MLYLFYLTATAVMGYMRTRFTTHGFLSVVPSKTRSRLRVVLRSSAVAVYSCALDFRRDLGALGPRGLGA